MELARIYHIFALRQYVSKLIGPHYPIEIIKLIIMADYISIKISCGAYHSAIIYDRTYVWGSNTHRQLGLKTYNKIFVPQILNLPGIIEISCGTDYTIARTNNKIYVWGNNELGRLGLERQYVNNVSPHELVLPEPINSVSCGRCHTVALVKNSSVLYVWGCNTDGQLGLGHCGHVDGPTKLVLNEKIKFVVCSGNNTFAIAYSGTAYGWGKNYVITLGFGYYATPNTPQKLPLINIISIGGNGLYTIALVNSGITNKVYVWGNNTSGQLGLGDYRSVVSPQKLNLKDVVSVSCGAYHTLALTKTNKIYTWGFNHVGQLGTGDTIVRLVPTELNICSDPVMSISCGDYHTMIVTIFNEIYIWGSNQDERLGLGLRPGENHPVPHKLKFKF